MHEICEELKVHKTQLQSCALLLTPSEIYLIFHACLSISVERKKYFSHLCLIEFSNIKKELSFIVWYTFRENSIVAEIDLHILFPKEFIISSTLVERMKIGLMNHVSFNFVRRKEAKKSLEMKCHKLELYGLLDFNFISCLYFEPATVQETSKSILEFSLSAWLRGA